MPNNKDNINQDKEKTVGIRKPGNTRKQAYQQRKNQALDGRSNIMKHKLSQDPKVKEMLRSKELIGLKGRTARKKIKNQSVQDGVALTSAIPPTRLTLQVNIPQLQNLVRYFAVCYSYVMQDKLGNPYFFGQQPTAKWNPSSIYAYLMLMVTNYFAKCGYLNVSDNYFVASDYSVPTSFAKWLQQLGPSKHYGRDITLSVNASYDTLINTDCGTGGLPLLGASLSAPCQISDFPGPVILNSEPYFSCAGDGTYASIKPSNLNTEILAKLSAAFKEAFKNTVLAKDIRSKAKGCELKMTPVSSLENGLYMFSVIDDNSMCDLILPLSSFMEPTLINSQCALQVAAPVRVDGSLAASQESKISFMLWLADQHPYNPKDTFITYLMKFGFKAKHLGNMQINLRQINWQSVQHLVGIWLNTLTNPAPETYVYLLSYVTNAIVSQIPGYFRCFSPVKQQWNLAKLYKTLSTSPNYIPTSKSVKLPQFVSSWIESLKQPIRSGNQLFWFYNSQPEAGDNPYWVTLLNGSTFLGSASNYGKGPIPNTQTGLSWIGGPKYPYPGFVQQPPPGAFTDAVRNGLTLSGNQVLVAYFQQNLITPNTTQSIANSWMSKHPKITKRQARFMMPSKLSYYTNIPDDGNPIYVIQAPVPGAIVSWEPATHHPAVLALVFMFSYWLPSAPLQLTIAPLYEATPKTDVIELQANCINAGSPQAGTQNAIQVGASNNPHEVLCKQVASAGEGAIPDQSTQPNHEIMKSVEKELKDTIETGAHDAVEGAKKITTELIKAGTDII